jgi:nicotinamide riboside transporter PnuC
MLQLTPDQIGFIAYFISLIGTILNIKKNRWCFIFWSVSNVLYITNGLMTGQWSIVTMFVSNTIVAIFGFIQWTKELKQRSE